MMSCFEKSGVLELRRGVPEMLAKTSVRSWVLECVFVGREIGEGWLSGSVAIPETSN